jgi:hypothetical protein
MDAAQNQVADLATATWSGPGFIPLLPVATALPYKGLIRTINWIVVPGAAASSSICLPYTRTLYYRHVAVIRPVYTCPYRLHLLYLRTSPIVTVICSATHRYTVPTLGTLYLF